MTYVRPSVARPLPTVRAAAAQAATAVSTAKLLAFLCWGCGETTHRRAEDTFLSHVCGGCKRVGHLEAVCWKSQPHLTPKWFMDKLGRGDAVSQPLPRARGSERDPTTLSRSASEAAIRRDFKAGKRSHEGRQEHYAKTDQMTTVALNDNLGGQVS